MAITGIGTGSYLYDYYSTTSGVSASGMEDTLGKITEEATDEELMAACKEFEAYFIEQVYKGMEKTIIKADEESENQYTEYFGDMMIQELSKQSTEQGDGIGLATQLYEQMKRNYDI